MCCMNVSSYSFWNYYFIKFIYNFWPFYNTDIIYIGAIFITIPTIIIIIHTSVFESLLHSYYNIFNYFHFFDLHFKIPKLSYNTIHKHFCLFLNVISLLHILVTAISHDHIIPVKYAIYYILFLEVCLCAQYNNFARRRYNNNILM